MLEPPERTPESRIPADQLLNIRLRRTLCCMYTIIEIPSFAADADDLWTEEERGQFFAWLAANPTAGDPIPGSGGCRKVRWALQGTSKRGGVRVIYFVRNTNQTLWLLVIYAKSVRGNIPAHLLKQIREVLEHEQE